MTGEDRRNLGRELGQLEGAGLITQAAASAELEYAFRHALIQDAAYETLLKQERRLLHKDVAETLLALYPEREADLAPVLADHFERAGDDIHALQYLVLAARGAASRYARREAMGFARRALAMMSTDEDISREDRELRAELRLLEAEAGADSVPIAEQHAWLKAVIADSEVLGNTEMPARAWLQMAQGRAVSGEQSRSSEDLALAIKRATELAAASGSDALIARAMMVEGQAHYFSSEFPEAIEAFERAVPALIAAGRYYGASIAAGQAGTAFGHVGDFDKAVSWTDRSYELGVTSGDPNASLDADLARSIVESLRGDSGSAIDYATKAIDVADQVDNKACAMVARSVIGEQHLREGDAAEAAIALEASADLAVYCQFMPVRIEQTQLLLQTARSRTGVGSVEWGRYERALELARQYGDRLVEAELFEQRAGDRIAAGQEAIADDDLAHAEALYEELGAVADLQRIRDSRVSQPTA